jgi:hypothetical protein
MGTNGEVTVSGAAHVTDDRRVALEELRKFIREQEAHQLRAVREIVAAHSEELRALGVTR